MATLKTALIAQLPIAYDLEIDYSIDPGDEGLEPQLHIETIRATTVLPGPFTLQECEIDEDKMEDIKNRIWESLKE